MNLFKFYIVFGFDSFIIRVLSKNLLIDFVFPKLFLTLFFVSLFTQVVDIEGEVIESEILPVFEDRTTLSSNTFQLNFVTELEPMAVKNFILKHDPTAYDKNLKHFRFQKSKQDFKKIQSFFL